jgi:outer membrane protein assembly factor BamB
MISPANLHATVLLCALLIASPLPAADQPQWGERFTRNMVSTETNLPDSFDPATGRNVKWTADLGTESHATPVIAGGRVLIGANNGQPRDPRHVGDRSTLMCFNEADGTFLWQLIVPKLTNSIFWDWPKAGICSPPTVEGRRAYVVSNRGEVLCLDLDGLANGNDGPFQDEARHTAPNGEEPLPLSPADADILWCFDIIKHCGVRQHDQAHASILLDGDFLYINTSNGVDDSHKEIHAPEAPSLIVLEKATGRLVAQDAERIGPNIFHSTWSSPALIEVAGQRRVIFCGGDGVVYGFAALSKVPPPGEVVKLQRVWRFDCDPKAPKEKIHDYLSNRQVSPSNIKSLPVFHAGRLYVTVGGDLWWGKHEAWLKCIDPSGSGDVTATAERWSYPVVRHILTTPAVQDGLVFVGDAGKRLHCVDAATGKAHWTHEVKNELWASALVADGKVYFATRSGDVLVFAASAEKQLLSELKLGSPISATPVAGNGVLYFTTQKRLYAVAKTAAPIPPP